MAMNMQMITRGWLVLRLENDSPLALVLVMVSFAAPMTVVSLVGGSTSRSISQEEPDNCESEWQRGHDIRAGNAGCQW